MIVVTVLLSILNKMEIHLVQNRKENCHHDHIPFNLKGNRIEVFECRRNLNANKRIQNIPPWQKYSTALFWTGKQNFAMLSATEKEPKKKNRKKEPSSPDVGVIFLEDLSLISHLLLPLSFFLALIWNCILSLMVECIAKFCFLVWSKLEVN